MLDGIFGRYAIEAERSAYEGVKHEVRLDLGKCWRPRHPGLFSTRVCANIPYMQDTQDGRLDERRIERHYSTRETAKLCGKSEALIRKLCAQRKMRHVRMNTSITIPESALREFFAANCVPARERMA